MTWAQCLLDFGWHAVDERRDLLPGVLVALCGHQLPMVALRDEPSGRPCTACADLRLVRAVIRCDDDQISGRPPGELPHHRAPRGRPGPTSDSEGTC